MPRHKKNVVKTSVTISSAARELWEDTSAALGIDLTATLELAVRRLAKAEGVKARPVQPAIQTTLAASAAAVEKDYNEDLSRPAAERQLTAFTILDGEPVDDGDTTPHA
jgi:hypothetical protein